MDRQTDERTDGQAENNRAPPTFVGAGLKTVFHYRNSFHEEGASLSVNVYHLLLMSIYYPLEEFLIL